MKKTTLLSGLVLLLLVSFTSRVEAGFGGFFDNVQKNLERDARRKAEESKRRAKERARQRAEEAQRKAISNVSQGLVDGNEVDLDNFKDSYKEKLKEGAEQKMKDKATEVTPLAACNNSDEMKAQVKSSYRSRIEAMRARLSGDKLTDQVVEGTTGVDMSDDEMSLSDKVKARLDNAKNAPGNIVSEKVDNAAGGLDSSGLSADNIDLNSASAAGFAAVEGIELSDGQKIVDYRNNQGSIEARDLIDVIGYKKYLILRTQIREDDNGDDEEDEDLFE